MISYLLLLYIHTCPHCKNYYFNRNVFAAEYICRDSFIIIHFSVTTHHFFVCSPGVLQVLTLQILWDKFFFLYAYLHTLYTQTRMYIPHICMYIHTRHLLISMKMTTNWHHRSLGSIPQYVTWEAEA